MTHDYIAGSELLQKHEVIGDAVKNNELLVVIIKFEVSDKSVVKLLSLSYMWSCTWLELLV